MAYVFHPRGFTGRGVTFHPAPSDHGHMETEAQDNSSEGKRFRISVAGRLDERFIDGIAGIELGKSPDGSTLEGPFVDQSQVRGILDQLWQLGIEVLRFETYAPERTDGHLSGSSPVAETHADR